MGIYSTLGMTKTTQNKSGGSKKRKTASGGLVQCPCCLKNVSTRRLARHRKQQAPPHVRASQALRCCALQKHAAEKSHSQSLSLSDSDELSDTTSGDSDLSGHDESTECGIASPGMEVDEGRAEGEMWEELVEMDVGDQYVLPMVKFEINLMDACCNRHDGPSSMDAMGDIQDDESTEVGFHETQC